MMLQMLGGRQPYCPRKKTACLGFFSCCSNQWVLDHLPQKQSQASAVILPLPFLCPPFLAGDEFDRKLKIFSSSHSVCNQLMKWEKPQHFKGNYFARHKIVLCKYWGFLTEWVWECYFCSSMRKLSPWLKKTHHHSKERVQHLISAHACAKKHFSGAVCESSVITKQPFALLEQIPTLCFLKVVTAAWVLSLLIDAVAT